MKKLIYLFVTVFFVGVTGVPTQAEVAPTIAVIDTGTTPSLFGDKIVAEYCVVESYKCANGKTSMEGPGASALPAFKDKALDHGTQMLSIIAKVADDQAAVDAQTAYNAAVADDQAAVDAQSAYNAAVADDQAAVDAQSAYDAAVAADTAAAEALAVYEVAQVTADVTDADVLKLNYLVLPVGYVLQYQVSNNGGLSLQR